MYLPTRLGGLGIMNPSKKAASQCTAFRNITAPFVELILVDQSEVYAPETKAAQSRAKNRTRNFYRQQQTRVATEVKVKLPSHLQKIIDVSSIKGASSWLSTVPFAEHGFALHKGAFREIWLASTTPTFSMCLWQSVPRLLHLIGSVQWWLTVKIFKE